MLIEASQTRKLGANIANYASSTWEKRHGGIHFEGATEYKQTRITHSVCRKRTGIRKGRKAAGEEDCEALPSNVSKRFWAVDEGWRMKDEKMRRDAEGWSKEKKMKWGNGEGGGKEKRDEKNESGSELIRYSRRIGNGSGRWRFALL